MLLGNAQNIAEVVLSGVCHRYPDLNFVSVENGAGWLPFLGESMDWQWLNVGAHKDYPDRLLPSEYLYRQVYGMYWFEHDSVRAVMDKLADNLMFETDFPHATSLSPGARVGVAQPEGRRRAVAGWHPRRDRGQGAAAHGHPAVPARPTGHMSLVTPEWCAHHFNHLDPALGGELHGALDILRADHPVTWSDAWGGFWVVTRYADVLRVAQDWETFSSAQGVTVPYGPSPYPALPEMIDPPEHRIFKRLINAYLTPAVVAGWEDATRAIVRRLLDGFAAEGRCEFMEDFARPLPGLAFFELVTARPAGRAGGDQPPVDGGVDSDGQGRAGGPGGDAGLDQRVRPAPPGRGTPG